MKRILTSTFTFIIIIQLFSQCTIFEASITVEETNYPVSMTSYLYSNDLEVIGEEAYEKVGTFKFTRYMTGIFHGYMPLTKTDFDLSDDINAAISKKGGNAMVNLKTKASSNAITTLVVGGTGGLIGPMVGLFYGLSGNWTMAALVTLGTAILPNISKVTVKGDIVKLKSSYLSKVAPVDNQKIFEELWTQTTLDNTNEVPHSLPTTTSILQSK